MQGAICFIYLFILFQEGIAWLWIEIPSRKNLSFLCHLLQLFIRPLLLHAALQRGGGFLDLWKSPSPENKHFCLSDCARWKAPWLIFQADCRKAKPPGLLKHSKTVENKQLGKCFKWFVKSDVKRCVWKHMHFRKDNIRPKQRKFCHFYVLIDKPSPRFKIISIKWLMNPLIAV